METKQQFYLDIENHLMTDEKPSKYLNYDNLFTEYPFTMIGDLKNAEQSPVYHPEGNVWEHTMLVVDEAAKRKSESSNERVFMWTALLHDIGKPSTTKLRNGKITSYDHDKVGADLSRKFLAEFNEDSAFIEKVSALIRWHMQVLHVVKSLRFADIDGMKKETSVYDVALLGLCDRMGRLGADGGKEEQNIKIFLEKCMTK